MSKPLGGRGKKVPYNTVVVRIPEPLAQKIDDIVDKYREWLLNNNFSDLDSDNCQKNDHCFYTKIEAIEKARKILSQKKGAKQSILNLLQVLYDCKIDEDELIK